MNATAKIEFLLGHWSAHRLESISQNSLRHGEAVAKGIALDVAYSSAIERLSFADRDRVMGVLQSLGFDISFSGYDFDEVWQGIEEFREHLGGELSLQILEGLGAGINVHSLEKEKMKSVYKGLCK